MEIKSTSVPASPRSKRYPSGSTVVRSGAGGGSAIVGGGAPSIDILKTTSGMPLSDANVLSSLRTLTEIRKHFIAKDDSERELTDANALSSLRTVSEIDKAIAELKTFLESNYLSKVKDDRAVGNIVFNKNITVGQQATTLNLLVDALAYVYDLEVEHVTTLFQTIIKDFVSSERFVSGMTGEGMKLYKSLSGDWNLELDNVTVRKAITTFEMVIAKIRSVNGGLVVSSANGLIKSVAETTGDPVYYVLGIEGDMTFVADDLIRCQVFTTGRVKYYWVPIEQINGDSILILKSAFPAGVVPAVGDELVQMGNRTDANRQGVLYLTASEDGRPRFSVLDGIDSPSLDGKNNTVLGCLDGITDTDLPADFQPSGYGLYSMNVFLKGIFILRNGKSIDQALTELSTQIEAVEGRISMKVTEEVGKIPFVGRNYLKNSGNWKEPAFNGGWCDNGGGYTIDNSVIFNGKPTLRTVVGAGIQHGWIKLENNVEYTYSAMIKSNQNITGNGITPLHYWAGKDYQHQGKITIIKADTSLVANEWKLLTLTFKLSEDANSIHPFIYIGPNTATFWIAYIKLEKGTNATDWTPAVEDIETRLSQAELKLEPDNIWMGIKSNVQLGGRNYFKKTTPIGRLYGSPTVEKNNTENGLYLVGDNSYQSAARIYNVINSNGYWTISFDIRGSQSTNDRAFTIDICDNIDVTGKLPDVFLTADNEWHHHEYTFNVQNYSSDIFNFVDFESLGWLYIYVRNLKIEKGRIATDWTPAVEDIEDTGVDISNKRIVLSADKTVFRNNAGGQIAVFENDRIKADLIDARQIVTSGLNAGVISTGNLYVTNGAKIGDWTIEGGAIVARNVSSAKILVEPSGTRFLRINDNPSTLMSVRADDVTGISIYTQNSSGTCMDITAQAGGIAINSRGKHFFRARPGEYIDFQGQVNMTNLCLKTSHMYSGQIDSDTVVVRVLDNNYDPTFTLPLSPDWGRMVLICSRNQRINVNGGSKYIRANGSLKSTIGIGGADRITMFIYCGDYWAYSYLNN